MVRASSCSLRLEALRSPAVTKSVVRSMALAPMMVMLCEDVAATPRVTLPVPLLLIVTV